VNRATDKMNQLSVPHAFTLTLFHLYTHSSITRLISFPTTLFRIWNLKVSSNLYQNKKNKNSQLTNYSSNQLIIPPTIQLHFTDSLVHHSYQLHNYTPPHFLTFSLSHFPIFPPSHLPTFSSSFFKTSTAPSLKFRWAKPVISNQQPVTYFRTKQLNI